MIDCGVPFDPALRSLGVGSCAILAASGLIPNQPMVFCKCSRLSFSIGSRNVDQCLSWKLYGLKVLEARRHRRPKGSVFKLLRCGQVEDAPTQDKLGLVTVRAFGFPDFVPNICFRLQTHLVRPSRCDSLRDVITDCVAAKQAALRRVVIA